MGRCSAHRAGLVLAALPQFLQLRLLLPLLLGRGSAATVGSTRAWMNGWGGRMRRRKLINTLR